MTAQVTLQPSGHTFSVETGETVLSDARVQLQARLAKTGVTA